MTTQMMRKKMKTDWPMLRSFLRAAMFQYFKKMMMRAVMSLMIPCPSLNLTVKMKLPNLVH